MSFFENKMRENQTSIYNQLIEPSLLNSPEKDRANQSIGSTNQAKNVDISPVY